MTIDELTSGKTEGKFCYIKNDKSRNFENLAFAFWGWRGKLTM